MPQIYVCIKWQIHHMETFIGYFINLTPNKRYIANQICNDDLDG